MSDVASEILLAAQTLARGRLKDSQRYRDLAQTIAKYLESNADDGEFDWAICEALDNADAGEFIQWPPSATPGSDFLQIVADQLGSLTGVCQQARIDEIRRLEAAGESAA